MTTEVITQTASEYIDKAQQYHWEESTGLARFLWSELLFSGDQMGRSFDPEEMTAAEAVVFAWGIAEKLMAARGLEEEAEALDRAAQLILWELVKPKELAHKLAPRPEPDLLVITADPLSPAAIEAYEATQEGATQAQAQEAD